MANTFELISAVTVGSGGASSIDFTSIPSTYTDLCVKYSLRCAYSGGTVSGVKLTFNNSSSGYSYKQLYAPPAGSYGTSSTTELIMNQDSASNTSSTFSSNEVYIPNYAGSTYKSVSIDEVIEQNASTGWAMNFFAGLWSNTAAITSIKVVDYNATNFTQYSTAYLYGVKNA